MWTGTSPLERTVTSTGTGNRSTDCDDNGNPKSATQTKPDGTVLTMFTSTYSGEQVTSTTNGSGVTTYFLYDDNGNLTVSFKQWKDPADPGNASKFKTLASRTDYDDDDCRARRSAGISSAL